TDETCCEKNNKGVEQWLANLPHDRWNFVLPEVDDSVALLPFVSIDLKVDPRNEVIEIGCRATGRVLRSRESEIVCKLDEHFCKPVGRNRLARLEGLFNSLPALLVQFYECSL